MNATLSRWSDGKSRRLPASVSGQTGRGVVLALLLVTALAAVAVSWRLTHAPRRVIARGDYAERSRLLAAEADRVAASLQKRRLADAVVMDLSGLDVQRRQEMATVVDAGAPVVSTAMTFRVRGVVPRGANPLAFIDDRTVGIGEMIGGFEVIAIAEDSVTFRDPSGRTRSVGVYGK